MKFKHLKNKEIKTNIFKRLGLSADASSVGSSWAFKYIWQGRGGTEERLQRGSRRRQGPLGCAGSNTQRCNPGGNYLLQWGEPLEGGHVPVSSSSATCRGKTTPRHPRHTTTHRDQRTHCSPDVLSGYATRQLRHWHGCHTSLGGWASQDPAAQCGCQQRSLS